MESLGNYLPIVNEDNELLSNESRLSDVGQAKALFDQLWTRDSKSRLERMKIQLFLDGFPPMNPEDLRMQGCANQANINIGLLKYYITEACRPLVDQINGVERFVNIAAKQEGDEDLSVFCDIVSEEHHRTVSKEPSFNFRVQDLTRLYVTYGVAVPYFEDEYNWIWKPEALGDFLIPHNTDATEDAVEVAFMVREMPPSILFNRYHNGNSNWNKSAIKFSLDSACTRRYGQNQDYEKWEVARKDNDLYWDTVIPIVNVVHCWVKELNGKISYYMFDRDNCKDYLFEKKFLYDHQQQAFQIFTYGVGTTGKYHGIRGLGYDALPLDLEINRTMSSFIDALRTQGNLNIQADDEDALENLFLIEKGGFRIVPPKFSSFTTTVPNYAQTFLPGFNVLSSFLNKKVSSYSVEDSDTIGSGDARKTKAEIMSRMQQAATAAGGNAALYANNWEKLTLEQLRRMLRTDYNENFPGGKQIKEFKKRCKDRGVPDSFWAKIDLDRCTVVPPVGAGSAAQQFTVLMQLLDFEDRGWFDLEGQQRLHRSVVTRIANKETAESLLGNGEVGRPVVDEKLASLENNAMSGGIQQPVWPNDNNQAHALIHVGDAETEGSIANDIAILGQAMQTGDEETLLRVAPNVNIKIEHTLIHVERMRDSAAGAQYRQFLEQTQGFMVNVLRAVDAIMKRQYAEAQAQAEQEGQEQDQSRQMGGFRAAAQWGETQAKLRSNAAQVQQSLRFKEEEHALSMNLEAQRVAAQIANEDKKTAAKIQLDAALAQSNILNKQQKNNL